MSRERITQTEYARRKGWSKQYVHQLVTKGRIELEAGLIDPEAADLSLAQSRDPARTPVIEADTKARPPETGATREYSSAAGMSKANEPRDDPRSSPMPSIGSSFSKARAVREHYRAKRERLEYEQMAGLLLPVDQIEDAMFTAGRAVRDSLMTAVERIVVELAHDLAAEPSKVRPIVSKEIKEILDQLAKAFENAARPTELNESQSN
ncbi:MAG TPA: hypothetical protein PLO50_07870 [Nitrospira sp.]|nr:hypothetical protein [Nitrospira sp.]